MEMTFFNYLITILLEIRCAMEEEMLSPFHYYGVTDLLMIIMRSIINQILIY
jgi:hypothetical protein